MELKFNGANLRRHLFCFCGSESVVHGTNRTWELVRSADSQAAPDLSIESSGVGPRRSVL